MYKMSSKDIMLGKTPAKSYEWKDSNGYKVARFHTFDWWDGKNIENLYIYNRYKGKGYSYAILDYAVNDLGVKNLTVRKKIL